MTEPRIFSEWAEPTSVPMSDDDLDEAVYLLQRLHYSTGERAQCARTIGALLLEVRRLRREIEHQINIRKRWE